MTVSGRGVPSLVALGRRSFLLWFGGIWLFVGVAMLFAAVGMGLQERAWSSDAIRTTGLVLSRDIVPADSDSSTQYRIRFRFDTPGGTTVEGDDQVDVETWERLTERGPVDVHYLPSSPESARLEGGADPVGFLIFLLLGTIFGVIGGILFGRAVRGLLRTRRLLRTGIDAEATVTRVEQTNVMLNRRPQFRVRYTYRDGQGVEHSGDSGYLDWEEATRWNEGQPVAIRYDPRRPAESQWIGAIEAPAPLVDAPPP